MDSLTFYKYQGTGNDFVIVDNRDLSFTKKDAKTIARICDRRFGIGGDGFILLENNAHLDFNMVYFNSDGNESTMCGNGGRCIVSFAHFLGIFEKQTTFNAIDGKHDAVVNDDGTISLQMIDVNKVDDNRDYCFTNTGSPHHVQLVADLDNYPVVEEGRKLRHKVYGDDGANINFVQPISHGTYKVRTYERGVEDETYSCGTGVTAVALAMHATSHTTNTNVSLVTPGGELSVRFVNKDNGYTDIWLSGPAQQVFKGNINI
ncbi:diaminopimelate epimerase [Nonlabens sp. SCSIO 43208]|uniref:diaminopimelate epimerase n=1 Tax=Nonlabens sp. SCSIO 43208 TaxID=2793009 RepID=UPI003D6AC9D7